MLNADWYSGIRLDLDIKPLRHPIHVRQYRAAYERHCREVATGRDEPYAVSWIAACRWIRNRVSSVKNAKIEITNANQRVA